MDFGVLSAWAGQHKTLIIWLIAISAVTLLVSALAVPWVVVRLPHDHFLPGRRKEEAAHRRHPLVHLAILIGKNVLGVLLLLLGIAMLILPGQGVLTLLAGLGLVDFPGRQKAVLWLVRRPTVLKSLNWIRQRAGRRPLVVQNAAG
jgi:hypothetical protein